MAKQEVKAGQTDYTALVYLPDPASTDGSGKTGLVAANLTVSSVRVETDNDVTVTDVTSSLNDLATLTDAHSDWGLLEVGSTLAPGLYRLDMADAVFATGAWSAVVYVMITTSAAAASPMEFVLVLDTPLTGLSDKTGYRLSATGVDDIHDEAVDGTTTLRESVRLANAALGGKASGLATTTAVYRNLADSKGQITATVDADGNRSAVTRDLT